MQYFLKCKQCIKIYYGQKTPKCIKILNKYIAILSHIGQTEAKGKVCTLYIYIYAFECFLRLIFSQNAKLVEKDIEKFKSVTKVTLFEV